MLSFPLVYSADSRDFSQSRGANQGEWILCTASPDVQYIAGKDAGPYLLIFMHGRCASNLSCFAAVAHISVAENINSLSEMCNEMKQKCDDTQISIISSMSTKNSDLTKQVLAFLNDYFPESCIGIDLGRGTSKAVLEIETGALWQQKDIPLENYAPFDADAYFQKAVIGIFNKDRKRDLEKSYDNTTRALFQKPICSREIIVYQSDNTLLFLRHAYVMQWLTTCVRNMHVYDSDEAHSILSKRDIVKLKPF